MSKRQPRELELMQVDRGIAKDKGGRVVLVIFSREHSSPSAYVVRAPRPRTRTDEEGREDEDEEVDDHETTTTPKAAVAAATVIEQTAPPAALAPFVHSISAGQTMSRFRSPSPGDLDCWGPNFYRVGMSRFPPPSPLRSGLGDPICLQVEPVTDSVPIPLGISFVTGTHFHNFKTLVSVISRLLCLVPPMELDAREPQFVKGPGAQHGNTINPQEVPSS